MSLQEMLTILADLCGLPTPRIRVSPRVVLPVVRGAEWFQSTVMSREPTLPSEPVRMATTRMEYDTSRARSELGYASMPARAALARAARWFVDNGFVKDARVERIRRSGKLPSVLTVPVDAEGAVRPHEGSPRR
jgi:nucleoside-diphosphate-sugar epimerase